MQILDTLITLDVIDWDKTPAKIKTIQLDSQTRYVDAIIQDKGVTYDIGENATVTLTVIRPDKTGVQITGQTKAHVESSPMGEAVTTYGAYAEFTPTALAVKGKLDAQFMITSGGQVLRTEIFTVANGEALDASTSEWAGEYQGYNLDELVQSVNESSAKVDAMETEVGELKSGFNGIEGDVGTLKGLKYLNSNAITLLTTILESAVYDDDMSGNIQSLITELNKSPFTQTETLAPIVTGEVNSTTFAYSQGTWQSTFVFEAGEIRGGLLRFTYDPDIAKKFNAVVYILDENDNPLKWTSYFSPENINVQGEWTPKYSNAGEGSGYSQTIDSFSVQIPSGCRAFVWVRAYYDTIIDGVTVTDIQGSFRNWAMNGGITVTVEG